MDPAEFGRRDDWEIEGMTDTGEVTYRRKRKKVFATGVVEDEDTTNYPIGKTNSLPKQRGGRI